MWAEDNFCKRNGNGIQEWPDGSKYEGEFLNNLKHGTGVFTWPNGEFYKGSFYRDYRHGNGMYSWPDGSKFTGKFYLNRKEGYGVQVFPDGSVFQGLYNADERFGPGVMTHPDGRQDVGLWHRERLLRLCTTLEVGFTLRDFPEHMARLPKKHPLVKPQLLMMDLRLDDEDTPPSLNRGPSEVEEHFILPPDIECYSTDPDHLPIPRGLRRKLDLHFFGRSDMSTEQQSPSTTALPLQQRMNGHIQRHRFEIEALDWNVAAVLDMNRAQFGPKGPLELNSEKLIKEASLGECRNVYQILKDGRVHPDVSDAQGHMALIGATVNSHDDVIHLLLDSGADVNKLNDEGMSALAVCNLLYYPLQSLHETLAEKRPQHVSSEPQIKHQMPLEYISDECSSDPITVTSRDESNEETFETPKQTNQADQSLELEKSEAPEENKENISENVVVLLPDQPEGLNDSEKSQAHKQTNEHKEINENKIVLQPDQLEGLNDSEEPQAHKQTNEHKEIYRDEIVLLPDQPENLNSFEEPEADIISQPECEQNGLTLEPNVIQFSKTNETKSIQVFDDKFPVGSVSWRERKEDMETDEGWERSIISDDTAFDSACSIASFHINVTEEILQKSAEILCQMGTVTPADTQETVRKIAILKTEHRNRWVTIKLLLERGADPNASTIPMPVIFLPIKAAHVEGVRRLLECGARTDIPLPPEQKGLYPLHIAAALPGSEGPQITELLLHALADPDVKAQDADEVYELDEPQNMTEPQTFENKHFMASGPPAKFSGAPAEPPEEGGRTPLHVACQRDCDYTNARDVVTLLLSHKASTSHLWSGHSPLSLAIASGNDLAVDELLAAGADPNLQLTRRVGSALCTLANISYDRGPEPRNQVKLLEKLIAAGADILMPVEVGEESRCAVGTVVDYAHHAFQQDPRVAQTPYHALNKRERKAYNARRQLLSLMGDLLRQAAIRMERLRMEEEQSRGVMSVSPSEKFVYIGAGCTRSLLNSPEETSRTFHKKQMSQRVQRKPLFKYCYQCGRSVGVVLSACSRCHEVFYCSKNCKTKAWDEIHKDECIRVPVVSGKNNRTKCRSTERRPPPSAKDAGGKTFHLSVTPEILEYDLKENYSFI